MLMMSELENDWATMHLPTAIEHFRAKGALIHDMPAALTGRLALHGFFTTLMRRDPGPFLEFLPDLDHERAYDTIANNVRATFSRSKLYHSAIEEGTLGTRLMHTFRSVKKVNGIDVQLTDTEAAKGEQKGITTAEIMWLGVSDVGNAHMLEVAIKGLLRNASLNHFYPVYTNTSGKVPQIVVENLDEHPIRSLSRSVDATLAKEDRKKGFTLPPTKYTLQKWLEDGETFPPFFMKRLEEAVSGYEAMEVTATYLGRPDLQPKKKPRIIGHDSAPVMENLRDIMNGLIHDIRGGSHHNLEQHPYKLARPLVEQAVNLRRDPATLEDVKHGPVPGRVATLSEEALEQGLEVLEEARNKPATWLVRSLAKIPGGFTDILTSGLEHLPTAAEKIKQRSADYDEWKYRKDEAQKAGKQLDEFAHQRRRIEQGLPIWPEG